jgi:hypothetical protein
VISAEVHYRQNAARLETHPATAALLDSSPGASVVTPPASVLKSAFLTREVLDVHAPQTQWAEQDPISAAYGTDGSMSPQDRARIADMAVSIP